MDIKVEKWKFDDTKSYKILELKKCCDEIINSNTITLCDDYNEGSDADYSVKLSQYHCEHSYEDYFDHYTYENIKYCPFCGEKINIEIVSVINKDNCYIELSNKRDSVWSKINKTDSKKKESLLRNELMELDNKINQLYVNDDLF